MADDLTFAAEGLDASSLDGVRGGKHWRILWRVSQKIPDVKFNQSIEKTSSNAAFKLALRIRLTTLRKN